MTPTDRPLTLHEQAEINTLVRTHLNAHGLSQTDAAKAIGVSATYVSQALGDDGSLPEDRRCKILRQLNDWVESDFRHRTIQRPHNWVETRVAELMIHAAHLVKASRLIGLITGSAGLGKSTVAQHLALEIPGTMLIEVDVDCRSERGLLHRIHDAAHLRRRRRTQPRFADVVDRLRNTGRLLIIDQAHDLRHTALPLLMNLHDRAELPILLLGTRALHEHLDDDRDPEFGQMASRIGLRVNLLHELSVRRGGTRQLRWIRADELRRIFAARLKVSAEAMRHLVEIANAEVGHLRRVKHLLRLAEGAAEADRAAEISLEHVREAMQRVAGRELDPAPPTSAVPAEAIA